MKRFLILAAIAAATATTSALAADVGVSVSIGEPGFYGRLDIGGYPQPQVMYRQPVVIEREVSGPPIYMRVPPGHAKNWRKHCREYNACGERVYFVQDSWYSREYVPRYQEQHRDRRDDRRGNNWNDGKGKGNDNGKGKGNNGRGNGRD